MKYDPREHHRTSIRLRRYDYSQAGAYFITVCTYDRECILGEVVNEEMRLNESGAIARDEWSRTGKLRRNVVLDEYVIMPNHVHGIIAIAHDDTRTQGTLSPTEAFGRPTSASIPTIIRLFKSVSTKRINILRKSQRPVWQRNYYEHIIRSEKDLNQIREYVVYNAQKWETDDDNPRNWEKGAKGRVSH